MIGVAVVEVGGQAIAQVASRAGGGPRRCLLSGVGERPGQSPARAGELARGPRQPAAHSPDVADRPKATAQGAIGRSTAVSLRVLGDRLRETTRVPSRRTP